MKHILVPVNATDESMKALKFAGMLAQVYDARLSLLLVTYFDEHTDRGRPKGSWLPAPLTGSVSRFSHAVFRRAHAQLPPDVSAAASDHHLSGQPNARILDFARQNHVDMIVMSCRRLSFFDTLLGGSVSRQILEKSICPVVIVK